MVSDEILGSLSLSIKSSRTIDESKRVQLRELASFLEFRTDFLDGIGLWDVKTEAARRNSSRLVVDTDIVSSLVSFELQGLTTTLTRRNESSRGKDRCR